MSESAAPPPLPAVTVAAAPPSAEPQLLQILASALILTVAGVL
jgi:hypothetical protein